MALVRNRSHYPTSFVVLSKCFCSSILSIYMLHASVSVVTLPQVYGNAKIRGDLSLTWKSCVESSFSTDNAAECVGRSFSSCLCSGATMPAKLCTNRLKTLRKFKNELSLVRFVRALGLRLRSYYVSLSLEVSHKGHNYDSKFSQWGSSAHLVSE